MIAVWLVCAGWVMGQTAELPEAPLPEVDQAAPNETATAPAPSAPVELKPAPPPEDAHGSRGLDALAAAGWSLVFTGAPMVASFAVALLGFGAIGAGFAWMYTGGAGILGENAVYWLWGVILGMPLALAATAVLALLAPLVITLVTDTRMIAPIPHSLPTAGGRALSVGALVVGGIPIALGALWFVGVTAAAAAVFLFAPLLSFLIIVGGVLPGLALVGVGLFTMHGAHVIMRTCSAVLPALFPEDPAK